MSMVMERRAIKAEVTSAPTDGRGTFDFEVHPFEIDSQNERVENFVNVDATGTTVPLDYQHTLEEMDPLGVIGSARVKSDGTRFTGSAQLDIETNQMAMAVYERLLLPQDDPGHLGEVSIWFAYPPSKAYKGDAGELVQVDAELLGLAVVHKGAQRTAVTNVKAAEADKATGELGIKAGRVISAKNESKLRGAMAAIEEVLASLGEAPTSADAGTSTEAKADDEGIPPESETQTPEASDELLLLRARIADLAS